MDSPCVLAITDCLRNLRGKIAILSGNDANTLQADVLQYNCESEKNNENGKILPYTPESKILVYSYVENKRDVFLEIIGHDAVKCKFDFR